MLCGNSSRFPRVCDSLGVTASGVRVRNHVIVHHAQGDAELLGSDGDMALVAGRGGGGGGGGRADREATGHAELERVLADTWAAGKTRHAGPAAYSRSSPGPAGTERRSQRVAEQLQIDPTVPPSGAGCVECQASGGWWFHLRRCAQCGHVGCCDDSISRRGAAHFRDTGHEVMQSYEPEEDWFWNFTTEEAFAGPVLADPQHHPLEQTVPGPSSRLPDNWEQLLTDR